MPEVTAAGRLCRDWHRCGETLYSCVQWLIGSKSKRSRRAFQSGTGGDSKIARCCWTSARRISARRTSSRRTSAGRTLARPDLRGADLGGAHLGDTAFSNSDLRAAQGLDRCNHHRPSSLDHRTLIRSGPLPVSFLRGCGLPEMLIDYLPSLLCQPIQFYSCFISYSHEDKPFARRLHDALQGQGIRCWLDEKQLLPGDDIHEQIDRGIRL